MPRSSRTGARRPTLAGASFAEAIESNAHGISWSHHTPSRGLVRGPGAGEHESKTNTTHGGAALKERRPEWSDLLGLAVAGHQRVVQLLDPATLPELPPELKQPDLRLLSPTAVPRDPTERERRRAMGYMRKVIQALAAQPEPGRNTALNHAAWTLGHWVAAGALDQTAVEDALYGATERNGLVADDGQRQCWATIRSGLSKGLLQPVDLDADEWSPSPRPRRKRRHARR